MFNLLPESLKGEIIKEYNLRRLLVIAGFILCIQVSFYIFLFPSWMISYSKEADSVVRVEQLNNSKLISDNGTAKLAISDLNKQLNIIDKSLEYPILIKYLNHIISVKSSQIKISHLSYSSQSNSKASLSLRGFSDTRDSLVEFKNRLEKLQAFKLVDLPISNYAKDKNIEFTINLNI